MVLKFDIKYILKDRRSLLETFTFFFDFFFLFASISEVAVATDRLGNLGTQNRNKTKNKETK